MQKSKLNHQEMRLAKKIKIASNPNQKRSAIRAYLNSYAARLVAVEEAYKKKNAKFSKKDVQSIAQNLNVWENCKERVVLHPKVKEGTSGDFRWLLDFGVENSARQILVKRALAASGGFAQEQSIFQGGRDEAIRRVKQNYEEGYQHVFELDVYRCFRSFDRTKIGNHLALPERVVTNVLSGVLLNISLSKHYGDKVLAYGPDDLPKTRLELLSELDSDWAPARQGLSEGSMASPLAAELLLAWIVKSVSSGAWRLVVYADNFLCQCQDEDAAHALNYELRELLHKHPAGPLEAKYGLIVKAPKEAFHFLGYALVPMDNGSLSPRLGDDGNRKLRHLRRKAYRVLNAPNAPLTEKERTYRATLKKQREVLAGFLEWEGAHAYLKDKEAKLRMHAELAGVSVHKTSKTKTALKLPQHI